MALINTGYGWFDDGLGAPSGNIPIQVPTYASFEPPPPPSTGANDPAAKPSGAFTDVRDTPGYRQANEWATEDAKTAYDRLIATYNHSLANLTAAASSGGGGGYSDPAANAELDQLKKDQAQHDYELNLKKSREVLGSRGMVDSGQTGFEAGELTYDRDQIFKAIDLQAKARAQSIAQSNAAAGAAAASRLAGINSDIEWLKTTHGWKLEDLQRENERQQGTIINALMEDKVWTGTGSIYRLADGSLVDFGGAAGLPPLPPAGGGVKPPAATGPALPPAPPPAVVDPGLAALPGYEAWAQPNSLAGLYF